MRVNTKIKENIPFFAWQENEFEKYEVKIIELKKSGYEMYKKEFDYLNEYHYYKNQKEEEVMVIIYCM